MTKKWWRFEVPCTIEESDKLTMLLVERFGKVRKIKLDENEVPDDEEFLKI